MTTHIIAKRSRIVAASPVYYGWIVWLVATIGIIATSPGQSYTVSLFFDFFIEDFGLSRTAVSSLYGLGTFTASLALTWVGWQIDRYGNRRMSVVIAGCLSIAVVSLSLVTGPFTLLIGFVAIRGLGQGSLGLVNTTVVAEWFQRLRGRMMSLTIVALALFQAAYIPWLQRQLEVVDWRQMWVILGIGVAIVFIPVAWLLMRNKPEEYGLLPDGERPKTAVGSVATGLDTDRTLREAMRVPIFWAILFGRFIPPAWGTGLIIHQLSIFEQVGHSARVAAETYALITLMMAFFSIGFGWMVDKLRPGWVMVLQLAALSTAMLAATVMTTRPLLLVYALGFGMMLGAGGVFDGAVWTNLFGRKHQASIRGFVATIGVAGSALGPVLFGLSFDLLGGYAPVLMLGVGLSALAALGAIFVKEPRKRKH